MIARHFSLDNTLVRGYDGVPMRMTISFLFLTLICACATETKYKLKVESWVGKKASDLIANFGSPDETLALSNGNSKIVYTRRTFQENIVRPRSVVKTGTEPLGEINLGAMSAPYGSQERYQESAEIHQSINYYCKTSFEVTPDGLILGSSFYGNHCTAN